ncbi:MAG: class II aldolase/adducin family protein [Bacilli bacterium]|uniref:class II aldolase/adducin family protein n=1 Tax=Anaerorhabdus sp. TaxID=1872524 RepID=UPI002FC969D3
MEEKLIKVIEIAKLLFDRGLVTGMTGNISFRDKEYIYISKSGSCFKYLNKDSFAKISLKDNLVEGKPSKEYPIHMELYKKNEDTNCVVHTHSINSVLISALKNINNEKKELFLYTPYLKMKIGNQIGIVDYFEPGTNELFENFKKTVRTNCKLYLLRNHGLVVCGKTSMEGFDIIEEFEQSCKILLSIKQYKEEDFKKINRT